MTSEANSDIRESARKNAVVNRRESLKAAFASGEGVRVTSTRRLSGKDYATTFAKRAYFSQVPRHPRIPRYRVIFVTFRIPSLREGAAGTTRRRESERVAPVRSKRWGKFRRRGSRKSLNLDCTSEMTLLPRKTSFRWKGISSARTRKKKKKKRRITRKTRKAEEER